MNHQKVQIWKLYLVTDDPRWDFNMTHMGIVRWGIDGRQKDTRTIPLGWPITKDLLFLFCFFVSGSQLNLQHHMFFVFGRSTNIPLPSGLYSCPEGWWVVIWDGPRYGKPWIIDSEQQKNPWLWDVIVIMDGKLFNWQKTTRIPQNILEEPHQKWWLGAAKQSHKDHVSVKFVTYKHL
jgi:hypothetical protein